VSTVLTGEVAENPPLRQIFKKLGGSFKATKTESRRQHPNCTPLEPVIAAADLVEKLPRGDRPVGVERWGLKF